VWYIHKIKKSMDYWTALRELYLEKRRLDKAIATLEALVNAKEAEAVKRRGRRHMPAAEREQVSARMRRYWEARRNNSASA